MRSAHLRARVASAAQLLQRDRHLTAMADALRGATALEPGGPSPWFGRFGELPVYSRLAALDTLDYSEQTIWSKDTKLPSVHRQALIGEATHLGQIADGAYDALLASHVVEHLANPLAALEEWQRVVRPGGHILVVMPHREGTFDHRRPVTSIGHLHEDRLGDTGEDDRTHLEEILRLHDLERDPGAGSRERFEARCHENETTRAMHHHVFDTRSTAEMCSAAGLQVLALRTRRPYNIFCLCTVGGERRAIDQAMLREALDSSPFGSDQRALELS